MEQVKKAEILHQRCIHVIYDPVIVAVQIQSTTNVKFDDLFIHLGLSHYYALFCSNW